MTAEDINTLTKIAESEPFLVRKRLKDLLATITPENPVKGQNSPPKPITDSQHNSWFLWLTQIEKLTENAGITWNQVVGQTHQLRITKNGLHEMGKQLMEALWGITSIKQVEKNGHIDTLIDHFTDLFSKVGLELPPFPSDEQKKEMQMWAKPATAMPDYPEDIYDGKAGNFDV